MVKWINMAWTYIGGTIAEMILIIPHSLRISNTCNDTNILFNKNNFRWTANQENRILFWEDHWTMNASLQNTFPRLYRISRHKHIYIKDLIYMWNSGDKDPQDFWVRELRAQEQVEANTIYNILREYKTTALGDNLLWSDNKTTYTTADMYTRSL